MAGHEQSSDQGEQSSVKTASKETSRLADLETDTSVWGVIRERVQQLGSVEYDKRLDSDAQWDLQDAPLPEVAARHQLTR